MLARSRWLGSLLCVCVSLWSGAGYAHVGAPDVYVKAQAGPYALLVSVHPPAAMPGAAGIDVRTDDADVKAIAVSVGDGAAQTLQRFAMEQSFTGSAWVSATGAWRVTIHVSGAKGDAETSVPIPAGSVNKAVTAWSLSRWMPVLPLFAYAVLVMLRRVRPFSFAASLFLVAAIVAGLLFSIPLSKRAGGAPTMQLSQISGGGLGMSLPGDESGLVEDHGHLMHLFAVRQPQMDVLLHLHPEQTAPGRFAVELPSMAPGAFALYADVVHRDGRLETFTATAGLPVQAGHVLEGDDSIGVVPGLSRATPVTGPGTTSIRLPDGYTMTLDLNLPLRARYGQLLRFALTDAAGNPPADMQLYMGMPAHAAVFKTDGSVFAHIHPAGTIPMAAYGSTMSGMEMGTATSQVSFPFGFPSAGAYRVFVQMKHGSVIETGAFDLSVPD